MTEKSTLIKALELAWNEFIPLDSLSNKQHAFLRLDQLECLYGGAARGGKSVALLAAALQYVDVPGYNAIILRNSLSQLLLPNSIMDLAKQWLLPRGDIKYSVKQNTFIFPSGARLIFGYLDHENDIIRYIGSDYHFVGFDELTQFTEYQYRFLFSRVCRTKECKIPLRVRCTSNPGGIGHDWVKTMFIDSDNREKVFIPATLEENPFIDQKMYKKSLDVLPALEKKRLLHGDWTSQPEGNKFKRSWFDVVERPQEITDMVRYWDLASKEPKKNKDPDYTVGLLLGKSDQGNYYVLDVVRDRKSPRGVEEMVATTAAIDGLEVPIFIEQEPGGSAVHLMEHFRDEVIPGYDFTPVKVSGAGSKEVRANPVSGHSEAGNVKVVRAPWNYDFFDEVCAFPNASHDDQVDALSGAFQQLVGPININIDFVPDFGGETSKWII